ncbi:unnamed protein product [Parascedosporium putredinis]|uniref:Aldehyde dehydrogenase domain-containing protein n=1 Tax=Parascedosporium putredinis TaxID=1442378 RepID=A0A9P1M8W4_9PEZI|nr:unnamed protein product [Parascedosporium putredinis]CAI7990825.1 unnamed protein product [Parascedosporium putredinis]
MAASLPIVPLVIDGAEVSTENVFDVLNPSTGEVMSQSANATVTQANAAVDAAAKAFESWSETPLTARRDIFLKAASILESRAEELKTYMKEETGSDEVWAGLNIALSKECLLGCASKVTGITGTVPTLQDPTSGGLIVKEPYGVVFAMAAWNAPYALGFRAVCWAIAAGNTVVFKGSEFSPRCWWAISSVLHDAGLPAGVLNYIACSPENASAVSTAIIEASPVKKINFTGSTAVGRILAKLAGQNLKPILLELGGKAPAIVCEDADLDVAALQCVLGSFIYAGQICMSTERILVHENIAQAFEEKLKATVGGVFPAGGPSPVLITQAAVEKNKALVQDAVGKGARIVTGDVAAPSSAGSALNPIIVGGVKPGMDIYLTESFGPTVSLITFKDEKEAIRIANDTEYGLSSAIFSKDLRRALAIAKRIETGAVHINRMTVHDEGALPHGGAKSSGFGRFNAGMDEWLRTKNITFDVTTQL